MHAEWAESFEVFRAYMGERPAGHTLDRIDGTGNYEPGNCRWATPQEQSINRTGVGIPWDGGTKTIKEIAESAGVSRTSLNKAYLRLGNISLALDYVRSRAKTSRPQI